MLQCWEPNIPPLSPPNKTMTLGKKLNELNEKKKVIFSIQSVRNEIFKNSKCRDNYFFGS